jgi:hypothetical protein
VSWSTLEVRWFFPGPLAESGAGVEAWFRSRARCDGGDGPLPVAWDPAPPAWREDRYLLVPDQDDMGIKWREGRLEIKGREAALGPTPFAPGIEGVCERWLKWSYAGEAIERRFTDVFHGRGADAVVTVEKRRLQRHLHLKRSGAVVEVDRADPRRRGVDVELAQIRVLGASGSGSSLHWSLGFEAFPSDKVGARFAEIVPGFLDGCPALPLNADRSMPYPRWLRTFDHSPSTDPEDAGR